MEHEPNIEDLKSKIGFGIKFWLEFESNKTYNILGSGWAKLLDSIDKNKESSLTQAAKECNYSYKYAWNILKRIQQRTGASIVETGKGGKGGGGWIKLTPWGKALLKFYQDLDSEITKIKKNLQDTLKI